MCSLSNYQLSTNSPQNRFSENFLQQTMSPLFIILSFYSCCFFQIFKTFFWLKEISWVEKPVFMLNNTAVPSRWRFQRSCWCNVCFFPTHMCLDLESDVTQVGTAIEKQNVHSIIGRLNQCSAKSAFNSPHLPARQNRFTV